MVKVIEFHRISQLTNNFNGISYRGALGWQALVGGTLYMGNKMTSAYNVSAHRSQIQFISNHQIYSDSPACGDFNTL